MGLSGKLIKQLIGIGTASVTAIFGGSIAVTQFNKSSANKANNNSIWGDNLSPEKTSEMTDLKKTQPKAVQIYNAVKETCIDKGISIDELRQTRFVERVLGVTSLEEIPDSEINTTVDKVKKALNAENRWWNPLGTFSNLFLDNLGVKSKLGRLELMATDEYRSLMHKVEGIELKDKLFGLLGNPVKRILNSLGTTESKIIKLKAYTDSKLSASDKEQAMKELRKEFILLSEKYQNDPEKQKVLAAMISSLQAEGRLSASKIFLNVAYSDDVRAQRAYSVECERENIVTLADALGAYMKQRDAVGLASLTYGNMSYDDIQNSITAFSEKANPKRVEEKRNRLNELNAKSNLSDDEEKELQEIEAFLNNYVIGGAAGSQVGLSLNGNISPQQAQSCCQRINEDIVIPNNIQEEVNAAIDDYAENVLNNPSVATNTKILINQSCSKIQMTSASGSVYQGGLKVDGTSSRFVPGVSLNTSSSTNNGDNAAGMSNISNGSQSVDSEYQSESASSEKFQSKNVATTSKCKSSVVSNPFVTSTNNKVDKSDNSTSSATTGSFRELSISSERDSYLSNITDKGKGIVIESQDDFENEFQKNPVNALSYVFNEKLDDKSLLAFAYNRFKSSKNDVKKSVFANGLPECCFYKLVEYSDLNVLYSIKLGPSTAATKYKDDKIAFLEKEQDKKQGALSERSVA